MPRDILAEFSIDEALALVDTGVKIFPFWAKPGQEFLSIEYKSFYFEVNKNRIDTLKKSANCACCETVGKVFYLMPQKNNSALSLDLFGVNKYGHLTMMTQDHIIPKSKGGENIDSNRQTLCITCNKFKSDRLISNEDLFAEILVGRKFQKV